MSRSRSAVGSVADAGWCIAPLGGKRMENAMDSKRREHPLKQFGTAVYHQIKLWDITYSIGESLNWRIEEVLSQRQFAPTGIRISNFGGHRSTLREGVPDGIRESLPIMILQGSELYAPRQKMWFGAEVKGRARRYSDSRPSGS